MNKLESFSMKTLETVRKKLGLTAYGMAKKLGLSQQGYLVAEKTSRAVKIDVLIDVQEMSGLGVLEFWELLKKDAAATKKALKNKAKTP